MQPPQQQPMGPQPYYGYPPPAQQPGMTMAGLTNMLGRRMIFLIIGLGILLLWVAMVARVIATPLRDVGTYQAIMVLYLLGGLIGFGGSLLGALGSPKTDAHQNHGLLVLAGFWLVAMVIGLLVVGAGGLIP